MGPIVRIILRYGVGGLIGYKLGNQLAADPDVVATATVVASAIVGLATEAVYAIAKRLGWKT